MGVACDDAEEQEERVAEAFEVGVLVEPRSVLDIVEELDADRRIDANEQRQDTWPYLATIPVRP